MEYVTSKNMPLNLERINYKAVPRGKERIIASEGMVLAGENVVLMKWRDMDILLILYHTQEAKKKRPPH